MLGQHLERVGHQELLLSLTFVLAALNLGVPLNTAHQMPSYWRFKSFGIDLLNPIFGRTTLRDLPLVVVRGLRVLTWSEDDILASLSHLTIGTLVR